MFLRRILALVLLLVAAVPERPVFPDPGPPAKRPKLVVILVVDQMRADYIPKFRRQWTNGLKRLVDDGAWFPEAAYPYMNTVTCAGHATIATGSFPATHGIVLNAWFDRASDRQVSCTDDPSQKTISYGPAVSGGHGPWRLLVPTLSDEMRAQLGSGTRVVTLSIKARSAMMLAGHRGDAVTWLDDASGAWVTSTAYAAARVPYIEQFIAANPVDRDYGQKWIRLLPDAAYLYEDAAVGEKPPSGWSNTFPHVLDSASGKPDAVFVGHWRDSPYADAYLGKMAEAAIDSLGLGKGPGTDYLGVSFSALDTVGHAFGPRSHEVQDILARLDRTIGALLAHLDKSVGAENYILALSADHGVAPVPEQMTALGFDAGRVINQEVAARIEKALAGVWGPGKYVARMTYPDLYFQPGVYDKLRRDPAALQAAEDAALSTPGVWRILRGEEVWHARSTDDSVARAVALSYYAGRSGDMLVMPKPYWFFVTAPSGSSPSGGTTHGTSFDYDARVPVILFGRGIKPGDYPSAISPADIAPTLAQLCGVTLAAPDGRVLNEALQPVPQRPAAKRP